MMIDCAPEALSDGDVAFVSRLIKEAGKVAVQMRGGVVTKDEARQLAPKTKETLFALISTALMERFPSESLVGEQSPSFQIAHKRIWAVDTIDGVEYYVSGNGAYAVMIGLIVDGKPTCGWVYNPCRDVLYVAEPHKQVKRWAAESVIELPHVCLSLNNKRLRLMMGNSDREQHSPASHALRGAELIDSGSIGLCVARILEGSGDVYLHMAGKMKVWETVAPAAMAYAAGLEVGSLAFEGLSYATAKPTHEFPIVIGRRGALAWARSNVKPAQAVPVQPAQPVIQPGIN